VPPGLGNLNASLDRFADFLRIDRDLIAAAAECSPGEQAASLSEREIKTWISNLSSQEKDALLERLINGDNPHLAAELRHRTILENRSGEMLTKGSRRTAGEIVYRAQILADARKKKEASQRARERAKRQREHAERRKRYLESLAGRENLLWAKVDKLIATRQPKQYDKAIILLQDLLDFSDMHNVSSDFAARMDALYSKHTRKSTLVERFRKAKLIG
jgi:hypothetical protein